MRRVAAALALVLVALAALAAPAASQQAQPPLTIRSVDSTDPSAVTVTFSYTGDRAELAGLTVREDERVVEASAAVPLTDRRPLGIVLLIDTSGSMRGALIERVLQAARQLVEDKAPADQVAVVTFNREVQLVQDFTADRDTLLRALEEVPIAAETALYDGIVRAAALVDDDTELQPNLIVFSDGGDTVSQADAARARAAVGSAGASLFAIGTDDASFAPLRDIAAATGGTAALAGDATEVAALFDAAQTSLERQYVVTYPSEADAGATVPVTLTVGTDQASVEVVVGSEQQGVAALQPIPVEEPSGPSFFRSTGGLALAIALVVVAAGGIVWSVGTTFVRDGPSLNRTLEPYGGFAAAGEALADEDPRGQQLAQTAILQRAVAATSDLATRRGLLPKVEAMLEQANVALRPAEALFFYLAGVAVALLLFLALSGSLVPALIGVGIVALVPPAVLNFLASRRRKAFDALLPDTLQLMASTLRAGFSLMQGVEAVSTEVSEPVGRELRRVVTEARLGRPLEEALDGVAERMRSDDFGWAVMAIRIQREVGGNLAELLVTVAETMTERERLRRDVAALTAEGKISAIVLGLLPIGLGGFIMTANPGYMDPLFDDTIGRLMLFGSIGLAVFGFWWMKKTIEIEI